MMECRKCGGVSFSKWGFDARSKKQLYKCHQCGGRVIPKEVDRKGSKGLKLAKNKEYKDIFKVGKAEIANPLVRKARYVVTAAQNATPVHEPFFNTLQHYCKHNDAALIVLPVWYKNPDLFHQGADAGADDFYAVLKPYIINEDFKITSNLVAAGRLHVNATAAVPLSGLDDIHGTSSALYGHPQLQMRMVPTPCGEMPKMLHTTGCCTVKNFSKTKAGQKAEFHHTLAALVVEVLADDRFIVREISWADEMEGVCDLDRFYTETGKVKPMSIEALVVGDEHVKFRDKKVFHATYGAGGIVDTLKPDVIVRHDIHDHFSASHHHESDPILKAMKALNNDDCVESELNLTVEHLKLTCSQKVKSIIVDSNHHDHLGKWLSSFDAKRDPKNTLVAWELFGMLAQAIKTGKDANPFKLFIESRLGALSKFVQFATSNDTVLIKGIDVSQHGHQAPNGARGSPRAFGSSARKLITGHTHTPGIERGVWTVGTSVPHMPYARGYSSWMTTHCVIYKSGKRAMIHIVDGDWRLITP